jgi:hypothetical protein
MGVFPPIQSRRNSRKKKPRKIRGGVDKGVINNFKKK